MKLYSSPATYPPAFQFIMKGGKYDTAISTHYGPYDHVKQDVLHKSWILDDVTGVFNVGSSNMIRIGYGKKTKKKKIDNDDYAVVLGKGDFCQILSKWANPLYDDEHVHRRCAEASIASMLYHLEEMTLHHSMVVSINQTEVGILYNIATGCILCPRQRV